MFKKTPAPRPSLSDPTDIPSGLVVRTENGVFFVKGQVRYRIITDRVLGSWSFNNVIDATEAAVSKYVIAGKLGFRDGTLITNMADKKTYLVSESQLRLITSPDVIDKFNLKDIIVSEQEINLHKVGENID